MDNKELKNLIKLSQKGDKQSFDDLYEIYYDKILYYILKRVLNMESAQDITSNVFLKVINNLKKFKWKGGGFNGWIYMIATNEIKLFWRDHAKYNKVYLKESFEDFAELETAEEQVGFSIDKNEQFLILNKAISQLKPLYQDIVTLRYYEEMSHKEIAEVVGGKENSIRVYLHRATDELKKILSKDAEMFLQN